MDVDLVRGTGLLDHDHSRLQHHGLSVLLAGEEDTQSLVAWVCCQEQL